MDGGGGDDVLPVQRIKSGGAVIVLDIFVPIGLLADKKPGIHVGINFFLFVIIDECIRSFLYRFCDEYAVVTGSRGFSCFDFFDVEAFAKCGASVLVSNDEVSKAEGDEITDPEAGGNTNRKESVVTDFASREEMGGHAFVVGVGAEGFGFFCFWATAGS